jgi:hypothetical protein
MKGEIPIFICGKTFGFTKNPSIDSHSKKNITQKKKVVLKDKNEKKYKQKPLISCAYVLAHTTVWLKIIQY